MKLQTFIIELSDQLKLLKRDFNTIQDTFFKGEMPNPNIYGLIIEDIVAKTDEDDLGSNHSVRKTESSELVELQPSPINTIKTDLEDAKTEAEKKAKEDRENIEQQIQQGQTTDAQNQGYLARKVVELQEQIKALQG
jgi:hypothetical protein